MKFIPYGKQLIDSNDKKLVLSSLSSELITTGPIVEKFEKQIKKYLNCKYSYVCNSGTSAIHLAMLAIGLKKNDIILMPAINFIASYNMAKTMQLKIYLVDVDEITGQITPNTVLECIRKNKLKKVKALITMFHGGYPENVIKFYEIKKKYNFFIIEDACHALGAEYKNNNKFHKIGSCKHADLSTFSLHPLKTITTGEGGIVTTNNSKIADKVSLYRNHGILRNKKQYWKYDILKSGYNYRLSDINCALGISQLKKIDFFLKKRKKIYQSYFKKLNNYNEILKLPKYSRNVKPSFHLVLINICFKKLNVNKDYFIKKINQKKIIFQQHYIPIYKFSVYEENDFNFPGSEKYYKNSVSIPIFVNLKSKDQNIIINEIKKFLNKKIF